jgi:hypothetical protein
MPTLSNTHLFDSELAATRRALGAIAAVLVLRFGYEEALASVRKLACEIAAHELDVAVSAARDEEIMSEPRFELRVVPSADLKQ